MARVLEVLAEENDTLPQGEFFQDKLFFTCCGSNRRFLVVKNVYSKNSRFPTV
jgi:hypothetical protein